MGAEGDEESDNEKACGPKDTRVLHLRLRPLLLLAALLLVTALPRLVGDMGHFYPIQGFLKRMFRSNAMDLEAKSDSVTRAPSKCISGVFTGLNGP